MSSAAYDELAASPAPSNAVIVSADIASEGGSVHRGDLVYLAGTAQKRGRGGGWSRPRVSKVRTAGRPFGVVHTVTQDLAAIIVSGACTVILPEDLFKKYNVGDRLFFQESINPEDYIKTIVEDAASSYSEGPDAFKELSSKKLFDWAIGPEPINPDTFSDAIVAIFRAIQRSETQDPYLDWSAIKHEWNDDVQAVLDNPERGNVAPPTQITRKFKIDANGNWKYTGKDLQPSSYGPLADIILYEDASYTGPRTPEWGTSSGGQQLTAAFEHAGLQIDKICKAGRRPRGVDDNLFNLVKAKVVLSRMLALSRFGPSNTKAVESLLNLLPDPWTDIFKNDIGGSIVDSLPFAMILEKGPSCTARILLGSMI